MTDVIETEMGTRTILLTRGGSITVTHSDDGLVLLGANRASFLLDAREALSLIEFLSVAFKPGSSSRIVEALPSGGE